MDARTQAALVKARRQLATSLKSTALADTCEKLRAFYYPLQRAYYTSKAKRRATRKTRRAGATVGGVREFIARALETPGWRGVYATTTLIDARARAWENDTQSGFADVLRQVGTAVKSPGVECIELGGVRIEVRQAELTLTFSNGSEIELRGCKDDHRLAGMRGLAKHVIWIDEAQDVANLEWFYKAIVVGCLTDFEGECWLSGTPGRDLVGMFFEVTRDDGEPLPGWEVHAIAVVDNPFFGRVIPGDDGYYVVDNVGTRHGPFDSSDEAEAKAKDIRWERTAGAAIKENGWTEDDPDLLREWYARWVRSDARFVYAVHAVPQHQLVYAKPRCAADGFPDLRAALADLPPAPEYFHAMGADLGTRDDFAFVVWSWSLRDPVLYELASWKRAGLDYDGMEECLIAVREQLYIGLVVADAGGGGKGAVKGWSKRWQSRYSVPVIEADKKPGYKPIAIKQMNTDIRRGHIRIREGGPLHQEWLVHKWAPMRLRKVDGAEHRDSSHAQEHPMTPNHCSDAALMSFLECYHHRFRPADPPPAPGSPEHVKLEESALERYAIAAQFHDDY